jgi:hypothetical protein
MDKKALAFAEDAIAAVGEGDAAMARTCVAQACEVDTTLSAFADAVYLACSEIENDGSVSTSTWNIIGDAVGPGTLSFAVEAHRS